VQCNMLAAWTLHLSQAMMSAEGEGPCRTKTLIVVIVVFVVVVVVVVVSAARGHQMQG